jgi:hypothetical protein
MAREKRAKSSICGFPDGDVVGLATASHCSSSSRAARIGPGEMLLMLLGQAV